MAICEMKERFLPRALARRCRVPDGRLSSTRLRMVLYSTTGADAASHATESLDYYKEIAAALVGSDEILLMGNGTGAGSAMTHLRDFLTARHADIARRVVGALTLDIEAMTEGQLLQEARTFFANSGERR